MPWRLVVFIITFGIFLAFIIFNLGNKCDISFGFRAFKDVPVFLTVFSSFILGMFCAVPFIFSFRSKRKQVKARKAEGAAKKKGGKNAEEISVDSMGNSFSDGGPYGIN